MNVVFCNVLHVEDDPGDKDLLKHACQAADARLNLHWASDGQVAVDYLSGIGPFENRAENPIPDLVLLDIKMPRKTGLEVLEWARARPEYRGLPMVMFTASSQAVDIKRAFDLGANSYIVKPTAYKDLVE